MDLSNISLTQVAAVVGAVGTIVGAGFTIDSRYAKHDEIDALKKELTISVDTLHKQILENEQLKKEVHYYKDLCKWHVEEKRKLQDARDKFERECG